MATVIPPPAQLPVTVKVVPDSEAGEEVDLSSAPLILPNAREAVPFESKRLKGLCLLKLRTDPLDVIYAPYFEGKKRTFEFMIQCQLKEPMKEDEQMWFGCEVPEYLSLGLVGRAIVRLMLAVANRVIAGVHSSLGDESIGELPHIAFPVESTVDRLVVTPENEAPPPLGVGMFPEGVDKQTRTNLHLVADTRHTYSFSMHGMYVDFVKWALCNMPGKGTISLRAMIGDCPLCMVTYVLPKAYKGPHTKNAKQYCFNFQMENSGRKIIFNEVEGDSDSQGSVSEYDEMDVGVPSVATVDHGEDVGLERGVMDKPEEGPFQMASVSCTGYLEGITTARGTWFFIELMDEEDNAKTVLKRTNAAQCEALKEKVGRDTQPPSQTQPASMQRTGSARTLNAVMSVTTTRLQHNEWLYSELNTVLQKVLAAPGGATILHKFLRQDDWNIATPIAITKKGIGSSGSHLGGGIHEGPMAVAMWESRWIECWAILDGSFLSLHCHHSRKAEARIALSAILQVSDWQGPLPFPAFFMEIHTLGRVYYLATATAEECQVWKGKIQAQMTVNSASTTDLWFVASDPLETYTVRQRRRWGGERIVLNERRLHFSVLLPHGNPNEQMEQVLRLALGLDVEAPRDRLVEYLDACSTLKQIPLSLLAGLGHAQRLAFFLNVYHCLLAHSLLVFGSPRGSREAVTFYSECSMKIGRQVFSLNEIETNILRAAMVNPGAKRNTKTQPTRRFYQEDPRSSLALQRADRRLMLVLHTGMAASGPSVPVYAANSTVLNSQLDATCRAFLDRNLVVNTAKKTVVLPRVCEQYQQDFGDTKLDVLLCLLDHCSPGKKEEVGRVLDALRDRSIRFSKDSTCVDHISESTSSLPPAVSDRDLQMTH